MREVQAGVHDVPVLDDGRGPSGDRVLTIPNLISVLRLVMVPVFAWLALDGGT